MCEKTANPHLVLTSLEICCNISWSFVHKGKIIKKDRVALVGMYKIQLFCADDHDKESKTIKSITDICFAPKITIRSIVLFVFAIRKRFSGGHFNMLDFIIYN